MASCRLNISTQLNKIQQHIAGRHHNLLMVNRSPNDMANTNDVMYHWAVMYDPVQEVRNMVSSFYWQCGSYNH